MSSIRAVFPLPDPWVTLGLVFGDSIGQSEIIVPSPPPFYPHLWDFFQGHINPQVESQDKETARVGCLVLPLTFHNLCHGHPK